MKKIYCEDCKYYRCGYLYPPAETRCIASPMYVDTNYSPKTFIRYEKPRVVNLNNDCKLYEKKKKHWWERSKK